MSNERDGGAAFVKIVVHEDGMPANWCRDEHGNEYNFDDMLARLNELHSALRGLERAATVLSNHDRVKKPPRGPSEWGKLHHRIDVARAAMLSARTREGE